MLVLTHAIKEAWRNKKVASVLFLDVQGAFSNVVKEVLIHNMRLRGVPPQYTKVTERMLTGRKMRLSFNDFLSEFMLINNGNNQGCPLSMLYYSFYNANLLEISPHNAPNEKQFGYVDDVALLATGNNLTETYTLLADMMTCPLGAFDWSESHNSQFKLSQLALMNFTCKPPQNNELTFTHPCEHRSTAIKPSLTYKFLGVIFDPKLKWNAQSERAASSAEAWINLVQRLARTSSGISAKGMRQLYIAIAIPKMSYAAEVWYTLPHFPNSKTKKRTGSIKFTQKLTSAQQRMTITMMGAMRTTASDVLNVHALLPPPHLLFLKTLIRAATRLVTLPDYHPLFRPTRQAINRPVKRHKSPLHLLFLTTEVKPRPYETILTSRRCHNYKAKANIYIENDRTTAITNANHTSGINIYSDGSGYEHWIGAAAVLMKDRIVLDSLRFYLGPEDSYTVYEAEALAVILAIHLACKLKKTRKIMIGLDNQAVLMGLSNQKSKPSHYLMDRIHNSLEDLQVTQARLRGKTIKGYKIGTGRTRCKDSSQGWKEWNLKISTEVKLIWTPGHKGIDGNEKADKEAKLAAQGDSSPRPTLPTFLRRKPLPISISVTRQTLKKKLKIQWKGEWSSSPRFARSQEIDRSLPSDDYLNIIEQLRRNQASLLTQLRTGHVPLKVILHRIKKTNSPECPHCRHGFHETIFHYLLICPHYTKARRYLQAELGPDAHSIPFLLNAKAGIPPLLRYISNTKRLRATFGEVRPDDDFELTTKTKQKDVTPLTPT